MCNHCKQVKLGCETGLCPDCADELNTPDQNLEKLAEVYYPQNTGALFAALLDCAISTVRYFAECESLVFGVAA